MPVTLLASACPPVQAASLSVYRSATLDTTAKVAPNIPGAVDWRLQANQIGAVVDQIARYGAGVYGIPDGPTKIVLTAPVSGLLLQISAGHAMIGGPVELAAASTYAVPDNTARVWIWLRQTGSVVTHTTTTTPPAGESCLLGSCVTSGGNITSLDSSGVVYLRGGIGVRATADDGAPSDTPPSTVQVVTQTAWCSYYWDGAGHRQQYVPNVTADPANPGANDNWYRTDTKVLKVAGGTAAPIPADSSVAANRVLASPNGSSGVPVYRALVAADLPAVGSPVITANVQSGTSYTLVLGDAGKIIEQTNASACTLTVPTNASVAFPIGTTIEVWQGGAIFPITIAAAGGVTLEALSGTLTTPGQYGQLRLRKQATNTWQVVVTAAGSSTNVLFGSLSATFDGGGSVLTVGTKVRVICPYAGTITAATVLLDQSGSLAVEVRKCTYAQYDAGGTHPVTGDKISASAPPTVTTATKSQDTGLTGWTLAISIGDVLEFVVSSVTSATWASVTLTITKS